MSTTSQEDHDRHLRGARTASWISLVAFAAVVVVTVVLVANGTAGWWLLLVDLLAAFVAVRTILRLVSISRALQEQRAPESATR